MFLEKASAAERCARAMATLACLVAKNRKGDPDFGNTVVELEDFMFLVNPDIYFVLGYAATTFSTIPDQSMYGLSSGAGGFLLFT